MSTETSTSLPDPSARRPHFRYRAGALVVAASDLPTLYEVISVSDDGLLRLRGVNWLRGYSALIAAEGVRPTSAILPQT
jgi:hypothetical protein